MNGHTLVLENNRSRTADYAALAKPGITMMVMIAAALGYISAGGPWELLFLHVLIGSGLSSAGANALNMVIERERDAVMERTKDRPVASGRMSALEGTVFGTLMAAGGILYLTFLIHPLAGALAAFTVASYLFAYTPLKRKTTVSALVGAVPGAVPPLIGWAAVTNGLETGAWMFFLVMFFWQLPHVLAIAWIYREDYGRAGYPTLPEDAFGRQAVLQSLILLLASTAPFFYWTAGPVYLAGAVLCGVAMLFTGMKFALRPERRTARILFFASILYLPVVLALLAYGG